MSEPAVGIEFILPNERKVFSKVSSIEIIHVTTTGNCDIITAAHMLAMKDQAIVCNTRRAVARRSGSATSTTRFTP